MDAELLQVFLSKTQPTGRGDRLFAPTQSVSDVSSPKCLLAYNYNVSKKLLNLLTRYVT